MRKKRLVDYQVYLFDKIHFAVPQLHMKEMILGFIGARCMLFWPHLPTEKEIPDLKELCDMRGFRMNRVDGKREKMEDTIKRTRTQSFIFFSMHLCEAYIGRLFVFLSTFLQLPFTQNSCIVILALLEIGSDRLLEVYKKTHIEQIKELQLVYLPEYEKYLEKDVFSEPQNMAQFLPDTKEKIEEKTGVDQTRRWLKQL